MKNIHTPISKLKYAILFSILTILSINLSAQYSKITDFLSDDGNNIGRPNGDLVSDGTFLYGMTPYVGNYDKGSIFMVKMDGTEFQKLYDFDGTIHGSNPRGSLLLVGSVLYGMTGYGGSNNEGVVFKINTDGTGFQKLLDFEGVNNGANPNGSLIILGSTLFGMTTEGGTYNSGVIFKMDIDGSNFQKLMDFNGTTQGKWPFGSLIIYESVLYGTTNSGSGYGCIFKINSDGTDFQNMHTFNCSDGSAPKCSLALLDTVLYGLTPYGCMGNSGTVFRININGSGFKTIYDLTDDGMYPYGSLTISGSVLYGMICFGGLNDVGIIFKLNTDGTGFQTMLDFEEISKGANPAGSLTLLGSTLYGMTGGGGTSNAGVVFKINTDGSGFSKIKDLYSILAGANPNNVITDGAMLYGTTDEGGAFNVGTIYKTNPDGTQFQKLFDFDPDINGEYPNSIALSGSTIYGTTMYGGMNGYGTFYKINKDGMGFQKITDFDESYSMAGSLILSGSQLYGIAAYGGFDGKGRIFKIDTSGAGLQNVVEFANLGVYYPVGLILSGSMLYGATQGGGAFDYGIIYKIDTNGNNFQKLVDFDEIEKGLYPTGSLIISDTVLYGTTSGGGVNDTADGGYGDGVIFRININGTGFQKLHDFDGANGLYSGSLSLLGSSLYGTTSCGGIYDTINNGEGDGVLYKINTDGSGFEKLLDFDGINTGENPQISFISNSTIYGTCYHGGAENLGVVFRYSLATPTLSVSPDALNIMPYANSNKSFTIASNIDWSVSSSQTWLTVSDTSGNGDAIITLTATANSGTTARTATITVSGGGITRTVNIIQSGITVDLTQAIEETTLVFPNPCADKLNIKLASQSLPALVSIYSVAGEQILQIETTVSETELNMADMKSGIYVLQIITSEQTIVERIIKR